LIPPWCSRCRAHHGGWRNRFPRPPGCQHDPIAPGPQAPAENWRRRHAYCLKRSLPAPRSAAVSIRRVPRDRTRDGRTAGDRAVMYCL
jgi:hypothetical protein